MLEAMPIDIFLQVIGTMVDHPGLRSHINANTPMGMVLSVPTNDAACDLQLAVLSGTCET